MLSQQTLIQGDSLRWNTSNTDYPSSTWTLYVFFNGAVTGSFTASAASDGSFNCTASSTFTENLATGSYKVYEMVSSSSERYTISETILTIKQNPTTVINGYDARSHVRKVYEAIQATVEGRATSAEEQITIAGRSLTKIPMSELLTMYKQYGELVRQEEAQDRVNKGLASGNRILVRF